MRPQPRSTLMVIAFASAAATAMGTAGCSGGGNNGGAAGAGGESTKNGGTGGAVPTGTGGSSSHGGGGAPSATGGSTAAAGGAGGTSGNPGANGTGGANGSTDGGGAETAGDGKAPSTEAPPVMGNLKFTRKVLHMFNYAEAIGIGDFNNDAKADVHSGPFWWEGPAFEKRHQFFPPPPNNAYNGMSLADWANYEHDVDGDGWLDSINVMRPSMPSHWYKNPGKPTIDAEVSAWQRNDIGTLVLEQSMFIDLSGEGKPDLVGAIDGKFGWFDVGGTSPWTFNPVGASGATNAYAWWHGIGVGDLDGDGKQDLITDSFWFTRPVAGPRGAMWNGHAQKFKGDGVIDAHGPSHMFGYDVDADGDDDVVTALDSHAYGVAWYENNKGAFVRHVIVGGTGSMATNAGMIAPFSQPHAMVMADIDGDGVKDLIAGKSFYAHPPGGGDPDTDGTPVFYVFKLTRGTQGVKWDPRLVDSEVGLGRQFATGDLNGDRKVDIAVASKHGAFLFFQE